MKRSRIAVAGLRSADPATLEILTADVLRRPITQLDPGTLADLLALSEVPDQTGGQLARDLTKFRDQMFRELDDLPDGVAVAEFCADLRSVSADLIPRNLRQRLVGLREAVRTEEGIGGVDAVIAHFDAAEPKPVALPLRPEPKKQAPVTRPVRRKRTASSVQRSSTPRRVVRDVRREEWIREDVLDRLRGKGSRGLKESILVAGARHRAPWKDLVDAEVLATLRKMRREGSVQFSAGRWMIG